MSKLKLRILSSLAKLTNGIYLQENRSDYQATPVPCLVFPFSADKTLDNQSLTNGIVAAIRDRMEGRTFLTYSLFHDKDNGKLLVFGKSEDRSVNGFFTSIGLVGKIHEKQK